MKFNFSERFAAWKKTEPLCGAIVLTVAGFLIGYIPLIVIGGVLFVIFLILFLSDSQRKKADPATLSCKMPLESEPVHNPKMENTEETNQTQWFYSQAGQRNGPVSQKTLLDLVKNGVVDSSDSVWHQGMTDWQPLRATKEFEALFESTPPPLTGTTVCNTWVWLLALVPLMGALISSGAQWELCEMLSLQLTPQIMTAEMLKIAEAPARSQGISVQVPVISNVLSDIFAPVLQSPEVTRKAAAEILKNDYVSSNEDIRMYKTAYFLLNFISLLLYWFFGFMDEIKLKSAGYGEKLSLGWILLVPVYLHKRATLLRQSRGYEIVWWITLAVSVIIVLI